MGHASEDDNDSLLPPVIQKFELGAASRIAQPYALGSAHVAQLDDGGLPALAGEEAWDLPFSLP